MKRILFLLLLLQVTLLASAYDIKVDGLCYNFTSESSVAVTYLDLNDNEEYVKGQIEIPASIDYEGKTYDVRARLDVDSRRGKGSWSCLSRL